MSGIDKPLVSVVVPTYNSARFVIETLESVKAQTYANLELLISDDASRDNTVELCQEWLTRNKERFVRAELITVPENTGISANCNRSIQATQSAWIKFIAGDDLLFPNCIEDNMNFIATHPEVQVLFSFVKVYRTDFKEENYQNTTPPVFPSNIMHPDFTAADQFRLLLLSDRITYTPSVFFKKDAVLSVGGYDERNKLVEDYPMWLKFTQANIRLYFMERVTVGYRKHPDSLSNFEKPMLFKPMVLKNYPFRKREVFPHLPWDIVWTERFTMGINTIFDALGLNEKKPMQMRLYRVATVYLNPFQYIISFRKKVFGVAKQNPFYR